MAIIRKNGRIQSEFKQGQLQRRKANRVQNRLVRGPRPREIAHNARQDFAYEQAQNRRWLDAQMQLPDSNITKFERKELHDWFSFPSLAAQRAPPSMKEGLRLSGTSVGHLDRLAAERDRERIRKAQLQGEDQGRGRSTRVADWWVSESEKRKLVEQTNELTISEGGYEMKKSKKQRDFERRGAYLANRKAEINEAGGKWLWLSKKKAEAEKAAKMEIDGEMGDGEEGKGDWEDDEDGGVPL